MSHNADDLTMITTAGTSGDSIASAGVGTRLVRRPPIPEGKYRRILQAVYGAAWAIQPEKLEAIAAFLEFAHAGGKRTPEEVAEAIAPRAAQSQGVSSPSPTIAIISIRGVISQRVEMMDDISGPGGTSTELVTKRLRGALNDDSVKAIVFDVDSPGGTVYGVEELATEIFKARGKKPMVAVVNSLAASAAYWIASAADEIVITPGGEAGSVGVYMMHQDISGLLKEQGVQVTFIQAAEFKTEGNPYEPLTDEARAYLQSRVDDYYSAFTKAVARGRGTTATKVKSDFGKGRVLGAEQAVAVGMADRIATFDQTIERLAKSKGQQSARAELPEQSVRSEDQSGAVTGAVLGEDIERIADSAEQMAREEATPIEGQAPHTDNTASNLKRAQRHQELLEAGLA